MTSSARRTFTFDDTSGDFSVNSQRPPVPGEENDQSQKNASGVCDKTSQFSSKSSGEPTSFSLPSGIPRRLTNEASGKALSSAQGIGTKLDQCGSSEAPFGFEPEGSTALAGSFQESGNSGGTPSCLKWAENFNYLLQDSDGISLFKRFLDDQDENCDPIDFWFACTGLKMVSPTEKDRIVGLGKLIYKRYIKGNNLRLKPDVKRRIVEQLKRDPADQTIFNEAQVEVENAMRNDMYPLFLKSDIYLQFVHSGGDSPKPASRDSSSSEALFSGSDVRKLPTLHEEVELKSETLNDDEFDSQLQIFSQGIPRICDGLPPDRRAGMSYHGFRSRNSNSYHISFAPVSAQDSELQSLSSEAPTDDTLSFTDSSVDGRDYAVHRNKMALRKQEKVMRRNADVNQTANLHQHFIPRTQIVKPDCNLSEKDPQKFASLLTDRLLKVKEEQDRQERFMTSIRSIQEADDEGNAATSQHRSCLPKSAAFNNSVGPFSITSMLIASGMTSNDHEDNAQSILDDHVSHIWNSSGVTPSRSPGRLTPDHQRRETGHVHAPAPKLRPKEVGAAEPPAVFPAHGKDGKFVHPSSSGKNQQHSGKDFRSFPARDVEPGAQSRRHQIIASAGGVPIPVPSRAAPLYHPSRPGGDDPRHSGTRNVDDLGPGSARIETSAVERHLIPTSSSTKKVMMWMLESEKYCDAQAHCSTDCSEKGSSNKRSSKSAGKKGSSHKQNRSESLDRNKPPGSMPISDFVSQRAGAQSGMADSKRPSADDSKTSFNKSNSVLGRQKASGESSEAKKHEGTVVGYYFCDEPIPYRTTVSGRNVTLGHLKQLIAKKGNYRYYCKKACNDFESGVVHEEVANDDDVLPLWDGKVVCKIERLA